MSLSEVAGVFDVRAAIDRVTGSGSATLVDGTRFDLSLGASPVQLGGVAPAATELELASCTTCGRVEILNFGVTRVRLTTAKEMAGVAVLGGLTPRHSGPAARIRWDVAVIP